MKRSSILLVDDDPLIIRRISRILSDVAELRFATDGESALRLVRESLPDLILLDSEMPGMSGFEVCETLKADPEFAAVAIIFVTSHSDNAVHIAGLELGAVDFITKPISEPLLLARVKSQLNIKRLTDELRRISTVDALTRIANRRHFDDRLAREWLRCLRENDSIAVLLIDVDYFKRFNDHYGHPAGDTCLCAVAQALAQNCQRPADLVARYGGEEFAVLLPDVTLAGAQRVAQRILDAMDALAMPHAGSLIAGHVTVSLGIGYLDSVPKACTEGELIVAADKALYAAKNAGRAQAWALDAAHMTTQEPRAASAPPGSGNGVSVP